MCYWIGKANVVITEVKFISHLNFDATAQNIRRWILSFHYYHFTFLLNSLKSVRSIKMTLCIVNPSQGFSMAFKHKLIIKVQFNANPKIDIFRIYMITPVDLWCTERFHVHRKRRNFPLPMILVSSRYDAYKWSYWRFYRFAFWNVRRYRCCEL